MTQAFSVFISSKMQELAAERQAIRELLPTLGNEVITFEAWVYENDAPAAEDTIRQVYLDALNSAALYLGIFWNQYGEWTIDEFERATEWGIPRHIYVKNVEADQRDPRLTEFLNEHSGVTSGVAAKWFTTTEELCDAVKESIGYFIRERVMTRRGAISAVFYQEADRVFDAPERLIGRDDMLAAITPQIAQGQHILLHGFGGTGKTALAATLAQRHIEAGNGPVLWLRAGSSDAGAVMEALAAPFNAQRAIASQTGDAQIAVMRQLIAGTGAKLVVLDDVWNGQALAHVLKGIPPGVAALVTARTRFPIPHQHTVGELDPESAREALSHYAGRDLAGEPEVDDLTRDLGHHAYALEIAGRIMLVDGLSPAELRTRFADTTHEMAMPSGYAEPERQSVAALLQVSLDALDADTRAVFMAFGAFAAPSLTPELLALYLEREPDIALTTLVRRGLAERLPADDRSVAHVRVHDLAHSYARANATNAQQGRALDACLTYVDRYKTPSLGNFAALRPVLDALLGAAEVAANLGRDADVERFAWGLYRGSEFLDYAGYYAQSITLLAQAAAAARKGNQQNQGAHLGNLGNAYFSLGQYEHAIEFHQQALTIAREIGDRRGEGSDLGNLGNAYFSLGQYARAIEFYQQALTIAHEIGDRRGEGNRLGNLGLAYANLGQYERAIEFHQQALTIVREIGDRRGEGAHLGNLGIAYANLGQYERAIEFYQQALTISRAIGDRRGEGADLGNLGVAYADLGQYERAIGYHEQALMMQRAIGDRRGEGTDLGNLGVAYAALGQYERAIEFHQQALTIQREIGDRRGEGQDLGNLGLAYADLGQYERAIEFYQQARTIFVEIGVPHLVEQTDRNIAAAREALSSGGEENTDT